MLRSHSKPHLQVIQGQPNPLDAGISRVFLLKYRLLDTRCIPTHVVLKGTGHGVDGPQVGCLLRKRKVTKVSMSGYHSIWADINVAHVCTLERCVF